MAQRLSSIKEHIVKRETKERATSANTVEFPQVKTLILDQLPKFTGSSSSQDRARVEWLQLDTVGVSHCPYIRKSMLGMVDRSLLKNVTVRNCPSWEQEDLESNIGYLFELTDELSKIEYLNIQGSKKLQKYMNMELQESSFRRLKEVEAFECDSELNEFLSILLRRSFMLERLTVRGCERLVQVFDLTRFVAEEGKLKFPNLKIMRLFSLPKLTCIWNKDPRGIVELGKLVKLEISECGGLRKSPLSTALLKKLILLEELKIESCKIEQVVEDDTEVQKRSFPNLKDLQLANLPELIKFNSGNCNFKFPNLLRLRIEKCPRLIEFTTGFLSNQMPPIEGTSDLVPLNEMTHACPKLQELKLIGLELSEVEVDSLSRLSDMRIAESNKLEKLAVRNCSSLKSLELPSNCLSLREIEISDCNILAEIATDPVKQGNTDEKTSGHLESMVLVNLPNLLFLSSGTCQLPSLKNLRIANCPNVGKLSGNVSAKADNSLDKDSALFDHREEESPPSEGTMKIPPHLKSLELADLPKMQLWKQEPKFPVFKNLTFLKIIRCRSIEKLFSIPVAKHLSDLKLLTLYGCENMVQVLGGGGGNSKRVVFQKLETLVLKHLPKLTSFCEEDVDFGEFPELKTVRVENIPKMEKFVKQSVSTPKLKHVYVTYVKKCWLEDLNKTIELVNENHDKLKKEVWKTDQRSLGGSLKLYADAVESSSQGKLEIKEAEEMELHEDKGRDIKILLL